MGICILIVIKDPILWGNWCWITNVNGIAYKSTYFTSHTVIMNGNLTLKAFQRILVNYPPKWINFLGAACNSTTWISLYQAMNGWPTHNLGYSLISTITPISLGTDKNLWLQQRIDRLMETNHYHAEKVKKIR